MKHGKTQVNTQQNARNTWKHEKQKAHQTDQNT